MFSVYQERADNKGIRTLSKVGDFATRTEANAVRPPRQHGDKEYPRMILYSDDRFINSTGW